MHLADREPLAHVMEVPANSRASLPLSAVLTGTGVGAAGRAVTGTVVRARSASARLYVEQATYASTSTQRWARGAAARGQR